jgi:hypothetical protein
MNMKIPAKRTQPVQPDSCTALVDIVPSDVSFLDVVDGVSPAGGPVLPAVP